MISALWSISIGDELSVKDLLDEAYEKDAQDCGYVGLPKSWRETNILIQPRYFEYRSILKNALSKKAQRSAGAMEGMSAIVGLLMYSRSLRQKWTVNTIFTATVKWKDEEVDNLVISSFPVWCSTLTNDDSYAYCLTLLCLVSARTAIRDQLRATIVRVKPSIRLLELEYQPPEVHLQTDCLRHLIHR